MAKRKPKVTPTRDPDEQHTATSNISLVVRNLTGYFEATAPLRERQKENFRMVRGGLDQWSKADQAILNDPLNPRPILSFNQLASQVNFLSGYQAERAQDYRAFPRGSDDEAMGRLATQQIKYAMDITHGQHTQHQQFRRAMISGIEWMEVAHTFDRATDQVEGDVRLTDLPSFTHTCDPFARDYNRQDAEWQGKLLWMTYDEAKRRWPTFADRFDRSRLTEWFGQSPENTG